MMITHHCEHSANKWGGQPEQYYHIHKFLDSSKLYTADWRHRILLHNTLGVSLVENIYPEFIKTSKGLVTPRTVAEFHLREDLGVIPTTLWTLRTLKGLCYKIPSLEKISKILTKEELRFCLMIYQQALNKSQIYYTTLGLELLILKFNKPERAVEYEEALCLLAKTSELKTPQYYLSQISIDRWMGGLKANQIKILQQTIF